jgi:hypothetical protein
MIRRIGKILKATGRLHIVEAEWELLRLRGLKVGMLHAAIPRALRSQLSLDVSFLPADPKLDPAVILRKHLIGMLAGDEAAKKELEKLLAAHDLTWDLLSAGAFESSVGPQLHTDRMAAAARDRRNAAYADLERLKTKQLVPLHSDFDQLNLLGSK